MQQFLGALLTVAGFALIAVAFPFFEDQEVRKWFPANLIGGAVLMWFGIRKYRDAY